MMASFALGVEVATIGEVLRRAASRKPNALYSVLFVTAAASASDIRKQYRQLARKVPAAVLRVPLLDNLLCMYVMVALDTVSP